MTYGELLHQLWQNGYMRIERDDRLLDVFPTEDREKGVELWEKWQNDEVKLLRIKLPFAVKTLQLYVLPKTTLEEWLGTNSKQKLSDQNPLVTGTEVTEKL